MKLRKELDFLIELEKLKGVERRSVPVGLERFENSAEHSWTLAVAAMTLAPSVDPSLDVLRVLELVLLHDVVEIDAGDTYCYADQTGKLEKEEQAAKRIFGLLPESEAERYLALWHEFEVRETKEAKFANALDRIFPLIQNFHHEGKSWCEHGITYDQIFERNRHIRDGSEELWAYALEIMDAAVERGWIPGKGE